MRTHISFSTILATVILMTGCAKQDTTTPTGTFDVTAYADYDNTRTSLADGGVLSWREGDRIGIYADGVQNNRPFSRTTEGVFTGSFEYTGNKATQATYRAYYPFTMQYSGYTLTGVLPETQNGVFDGAADFMVSAPLTAVYSESSKITGLNFNFDTSSHLFAILKLTLKDGVAKTLAKESVTKVVVSTADGTLAGTFSFDVRNASENAVFSEGKSSVSVVWNDNRPSLASPVSVYAVVKPTDEGKPVRLSVEVSTSGGTAAFSSDVPVTITRSKIKELPAITVSDTWKKSESINSAFSDANFLKCLLGLYDDNGDGMLTKSEITGIKTLDCSGFNIASLAGIELFTDLTDLNCSNNQLTRLSLTANTELLSLSCGSNSLVSIDVTKCTKLSTFNGTSLSVDNLDLSQCKYLSSITLSGGKIGTLNLKGCTSLLSLNVINIGLSSLLLDGCTALSSLDCYDNAAMTTLSLSGCTSLGSIMSRGCGYTHLDLSGLSSLNTIYCQRGALETVNLTGCTSLGTFYAHTNPLKEVDLSPCISLGSFTLTSCPNLKTIWLKTGQSVGTMNYDSSVTTIKYKN